MLNMKFINSNLWLDACFLNKENKWLTFYLFQSLLSYLLNGVSYCFYKVLVIYHVLPNHSQNSLLRPLDGSHDVHSYFPWLFFTQSTIVCSKSLSKNMLGIPLDSCVKPSPNTRCLNKQNFDIPINRVAVPKSCFIIIEKNENCFVQCKTMC